MSFNDLKDITWLDVVVEAVVEVEVEAVAVGLVHYYHPHRLLVSQGALGCHWIQDSPWLRTGFHCIDNFFLTENSSHTHLGFF